MLEQEIAEGTEIGKRIASLYENGQLVSDEIVIQLIEKRLASTKNPKGFIFKGFPRTLVQSYILDGVLLKHHSAISRVIDIEVPMLDLIGRLAERSKTEHCKPYDDSTSKIVKRLFEHQTKTIPVIEKYEQLHGVIKIDGLGTVGEVSERIEAAIEDSLKYMR